MLRSWHDSDASTISRYANNRKIWQNLRDGFPYPYTLSDAQTFIKTALENDPEALFAIATPQEAIGSIGLTIGADVHRFTAEIGYWLAEPYWGQGIMTGAVRVLVEHAFNHLRLVRVSAEPYASNRASVRVLEKAGFQYEGCLKDSAFKNGKIRDQLAYARTRLSPDLVLK